MTGLSIGVASMKSGERALLHVGWELAYGKEGNFSFPNVPPMSDVLYEVELIGFDETKEVRFCCSFQLLLSSISLVHSNSSQMFWLLQSPICFSGKSSKWYDCWRKNWCSRSQKDGWQCFIQGGKTGRGHATVWNGYMLLLFYFYHLNFKFHTFQKIIFIFLTSFSMVSL